MTAEDQEAWEEAKTPHREMAKLPMFHVGQDRRLFTHAVLAWLVEQQSATTSFWMNDPSPLWQIVPIAPRKFPRTTQRYDPDKEITAEQVEADLHDLSALPDDFAYSVRRMHVREAIRSFRDQP